MLDSAGLSSTFLVSEIREKESMSLQIPLCSFINTPHSSAPKLFTFNAVMSASSSVAENNIF